MADAPGKASVFAPYRSLAQNFALVVQMARRDVLGRYRGSLAGLLWSMLNPLFMLAIYTFVFGVIFKARWNTQNAGPWEFAVILFAGLNIYGFFAECANRAPTLIVENTNFVKKVVFPLETLAWSVVGSALFHLLVSTIVLLVFAAIVLGTISPTLYLFPLVVAVFVPFVAGSVWMLSSLGVFLRDLKQAIGVITAALMFLAPIFYPEEFIHEDYRQLLYLNPLTVIVEASRDVLVWGNYPDWAALGWYFVASIVFAWLAFAWFQRARRAFADVL